MANQVIRTCKVRQYRDWYADWQGDNKKVDSGTVEKNK